MDLLLRIVTHIDNMIWNYTNNIILLFIYLSFIIYLFYLFISKCIIIY